MMLNEVFEEFNNSKESCYKALKSEFLKIRTGRANIAMLDPVKLDYYGTPSPLTNVAQLSLLDARTIQIKPWDKSVVGDIEKAILKSDLGLTPNSDGEVIRINVPQLTEDRRKELVKVAKQKAEEAKISIRSARRDGNDFIKSLEKEKEISEDQMHTALEKLQKQTDESVKKIDEYLEDKEKLILEI